MPFAVPTQRHAMTRHLRWLPLAFFALLMVLRAADTGCHWCVAGGVAHHDLALLALLAGLLGAELLLPWRGLRWLLT